MKNLLIYLVIIVLIVTSIVVFYKREKSSTKNDRRLAQLNNIDKKISYFNYDYIDRYIKYKENNKNISLDDIITRVNIGLDFNYYENAKPSTNLNTNTILVNKYNYLDKDYIPDNLVEVYEGYSVPNMKLVKEASSSYESMARDMAKENLTIRVMSSYRSYNYQYNLYNKYVEQDGTFKADKYSARPGYSEHQTGLVIDIDNEKVNYNDFGSTKEYKWLQENSYKYGFILRFPEGKELITGYQYEPWHYRYVGVDIATEIKKHNLTLDEYCAKNIN